MARCIEETSLFNTHLFYINGEPMKFYLDGYYPHEIYRISKIIQAFGGECVKTSENAIILSSLNRPNRKSQVFYEIRYLYDCVTAGKTKDLSNYAVNDVNSSMVNSISETGARNEVNGELTQFMTKKRKLTLGCANCNTPFTNLAIFGDYELGSGNIDKGINREKRITVNVSRHHNPDEKGLSSFPLHTNCQSSNVPTPHSVEQRNTNVNEKTWEKFTENDDRSMIEFIIRNNAYEKFRCSNIWRKAELEKILRGPEKRTADEMRDRFRYHTIFKYDKFTNDPVALEKFAKVTATLAQRKLRKKSIKYPQCDTTTSVQY